MFASAAEHHPKIVDTMVTHRPDRCAARLSIAIGIFDEGRVSQKRDVIFRDTVVKGAGDHRRQIPIERHQFWISRGSKRGAGFDDLARIESLHRECIVAPIPEAETLMLVQRRTLSGVDSENHARDGRSGKRVDRRAKRTPLAG